MVNIAAGRCDPWWFGVAWEGKDLVATASAATRDDALRTVTRCVPRGVATQVVSDPPDRVAVIVSMLGELERGNEENKRFTLSESLSEPLRRILKVAAAIPIGYVTTYGNIAKAARSEARPVGRVMATNPLYPIVPCHRVVGADMSLVGYGGRQDAKALSGKLSRLKAETRGESREKVIVLSDGALLVYPAERVIEAVARAERRQTVLSKLESERAEIDRMQLRLF
jgi:methylated-DNA-[protein]-cysteine S-methyltransferase